MDTRPIGVFDSGLGGLTAVRELRQLLPSENIIYFGDTARVPYGGRSAEILLKYARQDVRFLRSHDIKAILVACGTVSTTALPQLRQEIGFVFQDFRLLENKTVLENVALASQVIGKPRHYILSAVPEALDLVGLAGKERRLPHELSGGEQQRVAIARAMVNRPKLLLADEPTGNLDPSTSVGIMRLLDRINRQGTTVVMATHDDEIVDQMRKRVIELKGGEVVRDQDRGVYGSDR